MSQRIKNLISSPRRWTKNAFFRDKNGHAIDPNGQRYVEWENLLKDIDSMSLYGAILLSYDTEAARQQICEKIRKHIGAYKYIAEFNDAPETTYQDLKTILDAII